MRGGRILGAPWLHAALLAAFPTVFLWGENRDEPVAMGTVLGLVGLSVLGALLLYLLLRVVTSSRLAAGFIASLVVALFFSFGHVRLLADPSGLGNRDVRLLVLWGLLLAIGAVFAVRHGGSARAAGVTRSLNVAVLVLVVSNLLWAVTGGAPVAAEARPFHLPGIDDPTPPTRDVYYIIFDRYASQRSFEGLGFDNQPTLNFLEEQGFVVADESLANYPKTTHSLASSLGMGYLDALAKEQGTDSGDWGPLNAALSSSRVAQAFVWLGYRYEHVGSWWEPTRTDPLADRNHVYADTSEFTSVFLATTIWPAFASTTGIASAPSFDERQYGRVGFQFEALRSIARDPEPTFAFAHFTLPHPPYVFTADGSYQSPSEQRRIGGPAAYLETVRFTNTQIQALVEDLLEGPPATDPIVILQSDEGPHPARLEQDEDGFVWPRATDQELGLKLRIFNAYYLPGDGEPEPYPTISPVNTFRLVFARYFGADLPLLEDRTYVYRDTDHPYEFTDVTSRLR